MTQEYLQSEPFTRLHTAEGREAAEHSFWRGVGLPAGVIPPGPEEEVQRMLEEEGGEGVEARLTEWAHDPPYLVTGDAAQKGRGLA